MCFKFCMSARWFFFLFGVQRASFRVSVAHKSVFLPISGLGIRISRHTFAGNESSESRLFQTAKMRYERVTIEDAAKDWKVLGEWESEIASDTGLRPEIGILDFLERLWIYYTRGGNHLFLCFYDLHVLVRLCNKIPYKYGWTTLYQRVSVLPLS